MNDEMRLYYDYTVSPLGQLFYSTVWRQLGDIQGKDVLDFGSGFAFTSNLLAEKNTVTAVEMDESILEAAEKTHTFTQILGDVQTLRAMPAESFDVVLCHLVLEFVDNPQEILAELIRVLKTDGFLSLVRHNRNGRIVQTVVQEYDLDETEKLLQGGHAYSSAFGDIKYYEDQDLLAWSAQKLRIERIQGVRALGSLHGAEIQNSPGWLKRMQAIEWELLEREAFIHMAYFKHLTLRKISSMRQTPPPCFYGTRDPAGTKEKEKTHEQSS